MISSGRRRAKCYNKFSQLFVCVFVEKVKTSLVKGSLICIDTWNIYNVVGIYHLDMALVLDKVKLSKIK